MIFFKIIITYVFLIMFYYYIFKFIKFCWNKLSTFKLPIYYKNNKYNLNNNIIKDNNFIKYGYIKRKNNSIMTPTELNFYRVLKDFSIENGYIVFSQVALNSIIDVNKTGNKSKDTSLNNKIQNKIIDFVLCSSIDYTIKYCIELDDYTHNFNNRIKRDEFLNEVFLEVGIPLKHIKVKNFYTIEDLNNLIK